MDCIKEYYFSKKNREIAELRKAGRDIISLAIGDPSMLWPLWNDMKYKDWFMALLDVESYIAEKERALAAYEDRTAWAKKMLVNIARSGYFSSDRTIAQYDADIWHLRPAKD